MSKPEKSVTDEYLRIVDLEPSEWDAQLQQIDSSAVKIQVEKLLKSSLIESSAEPTSEDDHESLFRSELLKRKIQVIKRVGAGGMAEVFLGVDLITGSRVAIKRPRIEFSSASFIDRFKIEYQAISRLEHPNICRVKFAGEYPYTNGESWYFVMEYVEGCSLDVFLQTREPTELVVLNLLDQIVDATIHAHIQSIVHRDLKPDNILVTDGGDIKIIDFGICEVIHSTCSLTHVEAGTHEYSPPEQLQGKVSNSSMDSYSLGMVISKIISSSNVEPVLKRSTVQTLELAKTGLTHQDESKRLTLFELKKVLTKIRKPSKWRILLKPSLYFGLAIASITLTAGAMAVRKANEVQFTPKDSSNRPFSIDVAGSSGLFHELETYALTEPNSPSRKAWLNEKFNVLTEQAQLSIDSIREAYFLARAIDSSVPPKKQLLLKLVPHLKIHLEKSDYVARQILLETARDLYLSNDASGCLSLLVESGIHRRECDSLQKYMYLDLYSKALEETPGVNFWPYEYELDVPKRIEFLRHAVNLGQARDNRKSAQIVSFFDEHLIPDFLFGYLAELEAGELFDLEELVQIVSASNMQSGSEETISVSRFKSFERLETQIRINFCKASLAALRDRNSTAEEIIRDLIALLEDGELDPQFAAYHLQLSARLLGTLESSRSGAELIQKCTLLNRNNCQENTRIFDQNIMTLAYHDYGVSCLNMAQVNSGYLGDEPDADSVFEYADAAVVALSSAYELLPVSDITSELGLELKSRLAEAYAWRSDDDQAIALLEQLEEDAYLTNIELWRLPVTLGLLFNGEHERAADLMSKSLRHVLLVPDVTTSDYGREFACLNEALLRIQNPIRRESSIWTDDEVDQQYEVNYLNLQGDTRSRFIDNLANDPQFRRCLSVFKENWKNSEDIALSTSICYELAALHLKLNRTLEAVLLIEESVEFAKLHLDSLDTYILGPDFKGMFDNAISICIAGLQRDNSSSSAMQIRSSVERTFDMSEELMPSCLWFTPKTIDQLREYIDE